MFIENLKPYCFKKLHNDIYLPDEFITMLHEDIDNKLVNANYSENGLLAMLKYGRVYTSKWTIPMFNCRGILVDKDYKVYARGFTKFFNLHEHERKDIPKLPDEKFNLTKKMDGSLGLICEINNNLRVFTSGSAKRSIITNKAKELLINTVPENWRPPKNKTILVEIISKVNPIVVDYKGQEKLVALALIDNETGYPLSREELEKVWPGEITECIAKNITLDEINNYPIPDDEEGYVLEYKSGSRAKIKGENYLKLHRLVFSYSVKKFIQDFIIDKTDISDLHEMVYPIMQALENKYKSIENEVYNEIKNDLNLERKDFAVKYNKTKLFTVKMNMYLNNNYEEAIWKEIINEYKNQKLGFLLEGDVDIEDDY